VRVLRSVRPGKVDSTPGASKAVQQLNRFVGVERHTRRWSKKRIEVREESGKDDGYCGSLLGDGVRAPLDSSLTSRWGGGGWPCGFG